MNKLVDDFKAKVTARLTVQPDMEVLAPASILDIQRTETVLGCSLPHLLKAIYLQVGNGGYTGFGPGHGLFGGYPAPVGFSMLDQYAYFHEKYANLPGEIIPICTWGCGIVSFIDTSSADNPVIVFDGNLEFSLDENGRTRLFNGHGRYLPLYQPSLEWRFADGFAWSFVMQCPTFTHFIQSWIDGVDQWHDMDL